MEHKNYNIFYKLNYIFLFYVLIATLSRYLFIPAEYALLPIEIIWVAILATLFLGTYFFEYKKNYHIWKWDSWKTNFDVSLFFLALFALRLYNISKVSLWLDEDTQAGCSTLQFPVAAGAYQSQPPLDMVFTSLGLQVSNFSVLGQRFHAALFSALAGTLIYIFSKITTGSRIVALTLATLFSFQYYVVQYGYEARPLSLALFCEILLFINIFILIDRKSEESLSKNWSLLALSFVYLCTLGLQPVFVVTGLILFLAAMSFYKKDMKSCFWAVLGGLICFIPIQNFIRSYSEFYLIPLNDFGIFKFLSEIKVSNYYILDEFFKPYGYLALLGFMTLALVDFFKKRKIDFSMLFLFFMLSFFCGALIPFYKSRINYALMPRYILSSIPIIFMLFATLIQKILQNRYKNLISAGVVVGLLGGVGYYKHGPLFDLQPVYTKDDLRAAYSEIKKASPDYDKNLVLGLALHSNAWVPTTLLNKSFYYRKDPRGKLYYWYPSIQDYEAELNKKNSQVENIFILYYAYWSDQKLSGPDMLADLNGVQVFRIKLARKDNLADKLVEFIEPVFKKSMSEDKFYISPLEYLVVSYNYLQDYKTRDAYLDLYKKMRTEQYKSGYLDELFKKLEKIKEEK